MMIFIVYSTVCVKLTFKFVLLKDQFTQVHTDPCFACCICFSW